MKVVGESVKIVVAAGTWSGMFSGQILTWEFAISVV